MEQGHTTECPVKKPFELFFTIDVKECIFIESANYARLKKYHGFKMILCKLKFFIVVFLLRGYKKFPDNLCIGTKMRFLWFFQ